MRHSNCSHMRNFLQAHTLYSVCVWGRLHVALMCKVLSVQLEPDRAAYTGVDFHQPELNNTEAEQ